MRGRDYKAARGNFWGDGYVHYFDCGDRFMDTYICPKPVKWYTLSIFGVLHAN